MIFNVTLFTKPEFYFTVKSLSLIYFTILINTM